MVHILGTHINYHNDDEEDYFYDFHCGDDENIYTDDDVDQCDGGVNEDA